MDYGTMLVATMSVVMGVGAPIALTAVILWHKSRNTRMIHETAAMLAEKGQPIPPQLFARIDEPFSDLRRGVILISLGLGLALFMYQIERPWSIGLIPLFMGIGYLIVWRLETDKDSSAGKHPA